MVYLYKNPLGFWEKYDFENHYPKENFKISEKVLID